MSGKETEMRSGDYDPRLVECVIGSVKIVFLVDSGATVNTVTFEDWHHIRQSCRTVIQDLVMSPKDVLKGYANNKPLDVLCSFTAYIGIVNSSNQTILAKFYVVKGTEQNYHFLVMTLPVVWTFCK